MNKKFKNDLLKGQRGEADVVYNLLYKYMNNMQICQYEMFWSHGKFSAYDAVLYDSNTHQIAVLEIKTDLFENENLFVELCHRDKPSGILSTESGYLMLYKKSQRKIYAIDSEKMRAYIMQFLDISSLSEQDDLDSLLWVVHAHENDSFGGFSIKSTSYVDSNNNSVKTFGLLVTTAWLMKSEFFYDLYNAPFDSPESMDECILDL